MACGGSAFQAYRFLARTPLSRRGAFAGRVCRCGYGRESSCRARRACCSLPRRMRPVLCRQPIPVTPLEVLALHSHARHRLPQDRLAGLVDRLAAFQGDKKGMTLPCPFLWDGSCLVYPVRPVACRQYMVFGKACARGEDASRTRPADLLTPFYDYTLTALLRTLPWYAGHEPSPPEHPTEEGAREFFLSVTTVVQLVAWNRFFRADSL